MTARAWLLFAASSIIWGLPYFFIKVAVDAGVPPSFLAWARVALGAAVLLPVALHRGALRGLRGRGVAIAVYASADIAVPFVLVGIGERYISSSLAAILVATMPLLVALMSTRLSSADKPSGLRLLGLVIGLAGVVALLGIDVAGRADELWGAALVLLATLGYAMAPIVVSRRLADLHPLGPVTASLMLSTVALLPAALAQLPHATPSLGAIAAIATLGVVCTAGGLVVFFQLIAEAGPTRASVVTYVNPVVAVIIGVAALGEHLGVMSIAGLICILGGSWLSAMTNPLPSRSAPAADDKGRSS